MKGLLSTRYAGERSFARVLRERNLAPRHLGSACTAGAQKMLSRMSPRHHKQVPLKLCL